MQSEKPEQSPSQAEEQDSTSSPSVGKEPWQDAKLTFVKPKLSKHHGEFVLIASGAGA